MMVRPWTICILLSILIIESCAEYGRGVWDVTAINKCEQENHKFKFNFNLMKINDTHDGFYGDVYAEETFTKEFGVRMESCIYNSDGECKPFQTLATDCIYDFFNEISKDSVSGCFTAAGIDPPEPPVEKGNYHIDEYAYNKRPDGKNLYGNFKIKCSVMEKDDEVGCLEVELGFKKDE